MMNFFLVEKIGVWRSRGWYPHCTCF